jgi:small GTP-binding protein
MAEEEVKVVLVGSQGVGKTCLVLRWVEGTFKAPASTIGAAFFTQKLTIGAKRIKMQVWDTAGQERFRAMAPMYYRGAHAACLVFDVSFRQSFSDVTSWISELRQNVGPDILLVIVANKIEDRAADSVSTAEARAFATKHSALYYETSAKTGQGVADMFVSVAEQLVSRPRATNLAGKPSLPEPADTSKCCS